MINFSELRGTILNELAAKTQEESVLNNKSRYSTFQFKVENINLSNLLGFVQEKPVSHFKSKDEDFELLAIGSNITYNQRYDYNKLLTIIEDHPHIYFMGAQRFDSQGKRGNEWTNFGECFFFLPKVQFVKKDNSLEVRINIPKTVLQNDGRKSRFLFELNSLLNFDYPVDKNTSFSSPSDLPSRQQWETMVNKSVEQLDKSHIEKIVLSRKQVIENNTMIESPDIYNKIKDNAINSYQFYLDIGDYHTFMSITPERLFKIEGKSLMIDSIAGTRARGKNELEDKSNEYELMNSSKELEEHRIVSREIQEKMMKLCNEIDVTKKESVLKLKFVQHIYTKFIGKLKSNENFASIINTFHPTPAVGGRPWNKVQLMLQELEPFDRGFYAAPVGYISHEKSEFAVGIRCALAHKNSLHIYGGCGVVKGSIASSEWEESHTKMQNFLDQI